MRQRRRPAPRAERRPVTRQAPPLRIQEQNNAQSDRSPVKQVARSATRPRSVPVSARRKSKQKKRPDRPRSSRTPSSPDGPQVSCRSCRAVVRRASARRYWASASAAAVVQIHMSMQGLRKATARSVTSFVENNRKRPYSASSENAVVLRERHKETRETWARSRGLLARCDVNRLRYESASLRQQAAHQDQGAEPQHGQWPAIGHS
jgi:hypothetical protein